MTARWLCARWPAWPADRRLRPLRPAGDGNRNHDAAHHATTRRQHRQRGFTLVEVLIALVLISLLMLLLTAAMRSMGQSETAIAERVEQVEDYRTAVNFVRDVLGEASARPIARSVANGTSPPAFFVGSPAELSWIGVMPARYGVGGRHYMRLALENGALVLRYAPWLDAAAFSNWGSANSVVLVPDVGQLNLSYQDPRTGQWLPAWPPEDVANNLPLPSAVQLELNSTRMVWPSLVVAVNGMMATDAKNNPVSFGGTIE